MAAANEATPAALAAAARLAHEVAALWLAPLRGAELTAHIAGLQATHLAPLTAAVSGMCWGFFIEEHIIHGIRAALAARALAVIVPGELSFPLEPLSHITEVIVRLVNF